VAVVLTAVVLPLMLLAAGLHALAGRGVDVLTFNDSLAHPPGIALSAVLPWSPLLFAWGLYLHWKQRARHGFALARAGKQRPRPVWSGFTGRRSGRRPVPGAI
jgi:hypothetical protein